MAKINNKKYVILSGSLALLLVLGAYAGVYFNKSNGSNNPVSTLNKSVLMSSSSGMTEEELISKSDLVVKGKIINDKEKLVKDIKGQNGEVNASLSYVAYKFKVEEDIAGNSDSGKVIDIIFMDSVTESFDPASINKGDDYVFYLYKCTGSLSGYYSVVSYKVGAYKSDENSDNLVNVSDKSVIEFNNLKAKVKAVKTK